MREEAQNVVYLSTREDDRTDDLTILGIPLVLL